MLATAGLLAILFALPSLPVHAASTTFNINVNAEPGAPSFTWTISGCNVTPTSGTSGSSQPVTMDLGCTYTVSVGSATGNGTLRYRLTSSYSTSVSQTSCAGTTCPDVTITAHAEEYLSIGANCNTPSVSVQSPTGDSWYTYGSSLTVSCAGVWGRSGGTGTRASSWNWDGGVNNPVATTGSFSSSLQTMRSHHALNVNKATQYQLTLDRGATLALDALTSPSITSDAYWYDSGTAVSYQGYGVFGRSNGFGNRSASWYLDSGAPTSVSTSGTFYISVSMSSPHGVHVAVKPQWQVSLDSVSTKYLKSITPPTISKDNYWYDAGTDVALVLNGTGARSGGVGSRLTSYSVNGGASVPVSTSGTSVLSFSPIQGKAFVSTTSTVQYQLLLDAGAAKALSSITPPSIPGDGNWYDSGTQVTYTGSGVFARASGTGGRVASWWLDSGPRTPVLTTGTFSAAVPMLGVHTLFTATATQYEMALTGTYYVSTTTSPTISGDDYWYDSGTKVSLSLQGEFGRVDGAGLRMVSYTVNNGAPIPTDTGATVPVLASVMLTSPQTISVQAVKQYQVTFDGAVAAALDAISPPTVSGDAYWYDGGSHVSLTVHGVWARNSTEGFRLRSYSLNGAAATAIASSGTVTILNLPAISDAQWITSNATAQYLLTVSGGPGCAYSVRPPIAGDVGWYDSGTVLRVSTNGTFDTSGGTRQRITSWSVDGGQSNPAGAASVVTTSAIMMDSGHSAAFYAVTQYLVTLVVSDSSGGHTLMPESVILNVNGGNQMATTSAWVAAGASLQVVSVTWHGVNVAPVHPDNYVVTSPLTLALSARVYDATIVVKDPLGLPIGGADCAITLANGTTIHASTSGDGTLTLRQIPIGTFQGTVSSMGQTSTLSGDAAVQGTVEDRLALSWGTISMFVVLLVIVILAVVFILRRYRRPSFSYRG